VFAELFTGLKITYKSQFIKGWTFVTNWKLDLGAGDVLQQSKLIIIRKFSNFLVQRDSDKSHLPEIDKRKLYFQRKKRKIQMNKMLREKGEKPNVSHTPIPKIFLTQI
jgi:hypothetical protein